MSEISERYRRLSAAFADTIAAVPADRWESPSPCADWTARDVVRHVVQSQGMFLGFVGRELGAIPSVDDDPLAAWQAASARMLEELEDPARATTTFQGLLGESTLEAAVDRFLNFDLVVHRWDLARATGGDETIDADDARRLLATVEQLGDNMQKSGAFGPPVEAPPDADEVTRLLALLGRRA